ncbi:hypothetical protein B0H11DRAFT_1925995 [Mycena galericulata]|nr:hypothetical protein B0H11DRAFT_1925995 [Mycena galericulata]
MLKFVYVAVLLAAQLPSFYGVSVLAPGSSFTEAMINLKNVADVFGSDAYNGPFPVNVTALEVIAEHIKDCSDAFDAALIQLASLANHAPSENYTSDWTQLASSTTSQYSIWLEGDGFNCGGAPCWLNGGNV